MPTIEIVASDAKSAFVDFALQGVVLTTWVI